MWFIFPMLMPHQNLLLIGTDQQRGDAIGVYPGSPVISPNLDRIAGEGVAFTRCISNSPLCVPARASVATGLLPRQHGVWSNATGADEHGPSHVRNIRDVGYHTAVIGKCHLYRDGPGTKPGTHTRDGDDNLEAWGFEHRVEVNDPIGTRWAGCAYTDYLASKGWLAEHQAYVNDWVAEMRTGNVKPWGQVPSPVPPGEDIDSFIGRSSVQWLEQCSTDRPFYLQTQFTGPHDPFDSPYVYRDRYDLSALDPGITELPRPPVPDEISRRLRHTASIGQATSEERRRWRAAYYGNITLIDEWIGRILDVLERRDLLRNTWIVFISDHGEQLGDHGLWGKTVFYQGSVHVPLIVRPPDGIAGWQDDGLTEQIDISATLLDIAGAPALDASLGRSLVPRLLRRDVPGKDFVLSELFGQTMLLTGTDKFVLPVTGGAVSQHFDLTEDPNELNNLVDGKSSSRPALRTCLEPLWELVNDEALNRYRDYVAQTGRLN